MPQGELTVTAEASLTDTNSNAPQQPGPGSWARAWWRLMDVRIGVIPLPVYVVCAAVLGYFLVKGKLPTEINVAIAVLAIGGFSCAELGKRLPWIGRVGGGAIFATFIPSALVYYKVLPPQLVTSVTDFTKGTNFLYLFITAIIVGSILGMDRKVLISGFVRIFIPLAAGSVAAAIVGTMVGTLLGLGMKHTLFFVVIPIMAGGVGEGAIPLSIGYSEILHQPQGDLFAQVLPVVMLGSLTAILISGGLNLLGKRKPHLTGEGRLQPGVHDALQEQKQDLPGDLHVNDVVAAGLFAISLYLLGLLCNKLFGLPAPVSMLFITVLVKLARGATPQLQAGSFFVFRFFQVGVTYPLLFAIGVAMTPWETLMAAFVLTKLLTIIATVVTLVVSGFYVGKWVKLYPIDAAIVNACHSGQGGTGDVAILTAANRMQLMPFAQIATRIGGAITVTMALILLGRVS
jgi:malate:Na+ symporter